MLSSPDFRDLLSLFARHEVKFLVVGGYAVMKYTQPRYTKDLDLWVSTKGTNPGSVFEALRAFGAPLKGLQPADFSEPGYFYQMGVPPLRVDIMMSIAGLDFETAWQRRAIVDLNGLQVPFISREDLLKSKRASGRPQDLLDAENLEKARGSGGGASPPALQR